MEYKFLSVQPKNAEKAINQLAAQGWKVVSQSESTWTIKKCFGFSGEIDAIINFTLVKEK